MSTTDLDDAFHRIGQYEGAHQLLNTQWLDFLGKFIGLDITERLDRIAENTEEVAVLDLGCGSTVTLFEAVENIEKRKIKGAVNGYGLTASTDYLAQPVDGFFKKHLLDSFEGDSAGKHRVELLLGGVSVDALRGFHRYSPKGNLIQIQKADVHKLDSTFPNQKFDLIYSSNAFPHFTDSKLVFEQALNAVNEEGLILIDSLPMQECSSLYLDGLQAQYSGLSITEVESDNPFYRAVVAELSQK